MRQQSVALAVALLLALALPAVGAEGEKPWEAPKPVKLVGVGSCFNYSRSYLAWGSEAEEARPGGLLASDGDLMALKDNFLLPYRAADGASLAFKAEDGHLRLAPGGRIVSLKLSEKAEEWQWLEKADKEALAGLRAVTFEGEVAAERLPLVGRLAEANPGIALSIGQLAAAKQVVPLFAPKQFLCGDFLLDKEAAPLRARLKDTEFLGLGAKEAKESLAFLGELPRLRMLLLSNWDPAATGPLPPIERLRSLIVPAGEFDDLVPIAHLTELEELHLGGCRELEDIGALARFTRLKALSLAGCKKVADLAPLRKLPGLQSLSFPPGVSQEQFAAAIKDHPELRIVELVKCEKVSDLAPLQALPKLESLVLIGVPAERAALAKLKALRFLVLHKEVFEKTPDEVAKLEKDAPGIVVVPGEAMCLGSAWLLLLVPVAVAASLVAALRKRNG